MTRQRRNALVLGAIAVVVVVVCGMQAVVAILTSQGVP